MSTTAKAIVIGAGVAGLASAIRLACDGFEVNVFEKNTYSGGKLSHFSLNGYQFDAGPSLFTQPENVLELFDLTRERPEDYFTFERVPVTCKYFYENGVVVNAYADPQAFAAEMNLKIGEAPNKIVSYLQQSEKIYNNIGRVFLDHSLHRSSLLKAPLAKAVASTRLKYVGASLNELNAHYFERPETVQLFNRFATYNGSDPFQAPGMLAMIPHLEMNQGTWYPHGGMKSITDALYRLAIKKGVVFRFGGAVQKIIHSEGWVKGVVAGSETVPAEVVVSNMDVYYTYKYLLHNEAKAKKLLRHERSSSAIIFYWGIRSVFPELSLHNIFFSKNYQEEFRHLFGLKTISDDPTVYINITSKMEEGQAPQGGENWFVMVNAPCDAGQDWNELKQRCRKAVIDKLNRLLKTDIESLIEVEETLDPVKIDLQTSSFKGALYGSSSNSRWAAFLRHPNFSSSIRGLYFAGGTVHPGGGIPLCLKSAKLVSELVKADRSKILHHH